MNNTIAFRIDNYLTTLNNSIEKIVYALEMRISGHPIQKKFKNKINANIVNVNANASKQVSK